MKFSNRGMVDLKAEKSSLQILGCQGQQNTAAEEVQVTVQNQKVPISVESEHMVGMGQGACLKTHVTGVLKQYERSRRRFNISSSRSSGHIVSCPGPCSERRFELASKGVSRKLKTPMRAVGQQMEFSSIDMVDLEEDRSIAHTHNCQGRHDIKVEGVQLALQNLQKPPSRENEYRTRNDHRDFSKTVVEDVLQHCTGSINGLDLYRSRHIDTFSESSATATSELLSSEEKFELVSEGATTDLNTQVKEKMGRGKEFSNRDMADLEADRSSVEMHWHQEQHHMVSEDMEAVIQNMGGSPFVESVQDLMSEEVQGIQSLAYQKPYDRHMIVSNSAHKTKPFWQKGLHQLTSKLRSARVSGLRPPQRLQIAGDRRSLSSFPTTLPTLKLEVDTSERQTSSHSEPNVPREDSHLNLGSIEAYDGRGHAFSAVSGAKSVSSTHNQLLKEKGVAINTVESLSRQDESLVATGPDFLVVGNCPSDILMVENCPSEQAQLMRQKRKLLSSNDSASGSACNAGRSRRARRGHCGVPTQRPIQVDELDSPTRTAVRINLDDDEDSERASQITHDESLAKVLQEEYDLEAVGRCLTFQDDAQVARMLQEEEYARRTQNMAQRSPLNSSLPLRSAPAMQAVRREMQRVLPSVSSNAGRSSSRMRILRGLHNRRNQHQTRGNLLGGTEVDLDGSLFHFPEEVDVDTRLNILAAIESMLQGSQSSQELPLEHLDRDFNENDYERLLALDDTNHERNGASHDMIERLPVSTIEPTDVYEEICSICLERPVIGDQVRRLPCMHSFHQQCIDAWLMRQANCPICKGFI